MDERTRDIIGALINVHRELGPGMLESIYEQAFCVELSLSGIPFKRQLPVALTYRGFPLDGGLRIDLVIRDQVVVELKAVEKLMPVHEAQLISYLRFTGRPIGLLVNFHVPVLVHGGLRRVTREKPSERA